MGSVSNVNRSASSPVGTQNAGAPAASPPTTATGGATISRDGNAVSANARGAAAAPDPLASYPVSSPRDLALQEAADAASHGDAAGVKAAVVKALGANTSLDAQIDVARKTYAMGQKELAGKVLHMLQNQRFDALANKEVKLAPEIMNALGSKDQPGSVDDLRGTFARLIPQVSPDVGDAMVSDIAKIERAQATLGEKVLPADDPLARRAQSILDRLAPGKYKAMVVEDGEENANTAGDNTVLITTGLLKNAKSDDEIAFVLGHELSHVDHGDFRNTLALTGLQDLTDNVGAFLQGKDGADRGTAISRGETTAANALDRQQELDADAAGLRKAVAAGYSPQAGVEWMRRQAAEHPELDRGDGQHPRETDRANALADQVAREGLGK